VRVASRRPERAEALAERHPGVVPVGSFRDAVRDADVVCLCTDAEQPVLEHDWLRPVAHVSSVGRHRELADATVRAALSGNRLIVEWRGAVTNPPVAGAAELQGLPAHDVLELGELLAGTRRAGESGLSAYKSTGHAVEDAAAARAVLDTAAAHGLGRRVPI
jgi:ornithine cyclodeaminase/alanine dehydrogenase-like protein (mu-crystallin family)